MKGTYQTKELIENALKTERDTKQTSFAEIVKGSCKDMVKEVTTKLDSVTREHVSRGVEGQNRNEVAGILDSFLDKEQRKMNLVIHNLQESHGDNVHERATRDAEKVTTMVREVFKIVIHITRCFRVGRKRDDKPRLLIISLDDIGTKHEILKNARELRNVDGYGNIFISPDLTKSEREQGKKTRDELSRRRNAGEKDLVIWRGKIIKKTVQHEATRSAPPEAAHRDHGVPVPNHRHQVSHNGRATVSTVSDEPVVDITPRAGGHDLGTGQEGTGIFNDTPQQHLAGSASAVFQMHDPPRVQN